MKGTMKHQRKRKKANDTHAAIQRAHRERHLPHVVHIHAWKIKGRKQHYQETRVIKHNPPDADACLTCQHFAVYFPYCSGNGMFNSRSRCKRPLEMWNLTQESDSVRCLWVCTRVCIFWEGCRREEEAKKSWETTVRHHCTFLFMLLSYSGKYSDYAHQHLQPKWAHATVEKPIDEGMSVFATTIKPYSNY